MGDNFTTQDPSVPSQNVLDLRAKSLEQQPLLAKSEPRALRFSRPRLRQFRLPRFSWIRPSPAAWSMLRFIAVAVVLVAPFLATPFIRSLLTTKAEVFAASQEAYGSFRLAGDQAIALDLPSARASFQEALAHIEEAETKLKSLHQGVQVVLRTLPWTGSSYRSAEHLFEAGRAIAEAGTIFTDTVEAITQVNVDESESRDRPTVRFAASTLTENATQLGVQLRRATNALGKIRARDLPDSYQEAFHLIQLRLPELRQAVERFESTAAVFATLFSGDEERQYLLVFQNSNELRATGGFMGSFALVSVTSGEVKVLEVPGRGFLDLQYAGMPLKKAPEPLRLINALWQPQDANWWPDFPTSAAAILDLYRQSRGYDVNGVIAVTPQLIESLLALTGPVKLEQSGVTVDERSLTAVLQEEVEVNYDRALNQPKQVIGELMPVLLNRALSLPIERFLDLGTVLASSLEQRDLLVAVGDPEAQAEIEKLGWSGQVRSAPNDYLFVVDSNVGGGKTDGVMSQSVRHEVRIDESGEMTVALTITRQHHGTEGDPWTGLTNVDYLRVYVPEGSELRSASGWSSIGSDRIQSYPDESSDDERIAQLEQAEFQADRNTWIGSQFGKTVFSNWVEVPVGGERTIRLEYRLPFRVTQDSPRYSLLVQAQPGVAHRQFSSQLTFPDALEPAWLEPTHTSLFRLGQTVQYTADGRRDRSYGVLFREAQ